MKLLFYLFILTILLSKPIFAQTPTDSASIAWKKILKKEQALIQKHKKDTIKKNVWWANEVIEFSSEYSKINKSAQQILGEPNAMPIGGESKVAWAVKEKKGKEIKGDGKIIVSYKDAHIIQQIIVSENYNPGSIKYIIMYGENGESEIAYARMPKSIKKEYRMLNIILEEPSSFKVKKLEIQTNPHAVQGRNEIDAIGLSDSKDTIYWHINHLPKVKFLAQPENLGSNINTVYDEIAPIISPDGKYLFFDRRYYPQNIGEKRDKDDIWYSEKQTDSTWSLAKNIGPPLNNEFPNFIQAVTSDGNSVLLANEYLPSGELAPGVSISNKTKDGWSFPIIQNIRKFRNHSQHANYFLTSDGQYLLMAIEGNDSYGELDLYVSQRLSDNEWSEPKNLGADINTIAHDYSPFLATDGLSLYFSSEGHAGYGKADIFVSKRLDDSWQHWSKPQNLGPVINSKDMDSKYNIPASGEYAYFSSTHNSIGRNDIYRIKLPKEIKPNPVVLVSGFVLNKKDSSALDARVIVEKLPEGTEIAIARSNPNNGAFSIVLQANQQYGFRAVALNYFDDNRNLDISDIKRYTEIKDQNLYLSPIEVGQIVRLNNIFFETDKSILKPESFPELNRAVKFLSSNPNLEIEVAGHTDNVGSDSYNLRLSDNRAKAVATYLIQKGIDQNRIVSKGYGESQPETTNDTEEGRQINRRVEFRILKK